MLVLTRKIGEQVRIGDSLVTLVEIRGNKIRLGVEAPREVPISRPESHSPGKP